MLRKLFYKAKLKLQLLDLTSLRFLCMGLVDVDSNDSIYFLPFVLDSSSEHDADEDVLCIDNELDGELAICDNWLS